MSTFALVSLLLAAYFLINLVCALVLHLHGERQAHLRPRFLDVLVHFVLLTALAIPVLLVTTAAALFGGKEDARLSRVASTPQTSAKAA